MSDYWDVIVVGAGAGGLAAAVSAAEAGARVIVFESEPELGGSMSLSGGVFYAGGTSVQEALGIDDSPQRFYQHYMDLNEWVLRTGPVGVFCQQAAPTFEWLLTLGLQVPAHLSSSGQQPGLRRIGEEDVRRGHVPVDEGYGLTQILDKARRKHHVDVVLHTRIQQLVIEGGRCCGVVADGVEARSAAVVIATGGMAHNPSLLAEYFPDVAVAGDNLFVTAGSGSRGDHIELGSQVDAAIAGRGWGMLLSGAYFQGLNYTQAGSPPAARLMVDGTGRRFVNEDATYVPMFAMLKHVGGFGWTIFDDAARAALDPTYASWTPGNILAEVDAGRTFRGQDLTDLASQIAVPPAALGATVDRWNETLPHGRDDDFGRHVTLSESGHPLPSPISIGPFFAVRTQPLQLIQTHAGLEIDSHARVVNRTGTPVPGLYAAGEAGGGVLGKHYVGATSLGNALTMGRVAGVGAAGLAR